MFAVCMQRSLQKLFWIWNSSNSTDAQQVPQQSPPTVEVTPPDSHPEGNGVMEEQSEGDGQSKILLHTLPDGQ